MEGWCFKRLMATRRIHEILLVRVRSRTRLAEKYKVLHRLLFVGRTISDSDLRKQIQKTSDKAHSAAVANDPNEFPEAVAVGSADCVYVRYLPTKDELEAVHRAENRVFIAGSTVSGNVPENWQHAADLGIDAILTDYPLILRTTLRVED